VWHVQSAWGHVVVWDHVVVWGHVVGHVVLELVGDHVIYHMPLSLDHMSSSQDHVGESSSSRFGYSLALGVG